MRIGIILRAGQGQILRIPETEEIASPPITLGIERWLRAAAPLKPRAADRSYTLNLTGSMEGYRCSINNVAWSPEVPPLSIVEGERVELILVNRTKMAHPVHLHGHPFQVVAIGENRSPGRFATRCWSPKKRL
jgi:FtsP/CotA-like multicopper oxidase with cupredoxin domain